MSLVRKIYIDSRTCSGDPSDFTATLPEPIRADPSLGIILSQLTFVNNFNTVMTGYSDRLYFGVNVPDVSGVVTANVNDRVYLRVIDSRDTEAGAVDRIFVIPPATYTLATLRTALQTVLRTVYADWTVTDTAIQTPGYRLVIPSLAEVTSPDWANNTWNGPLYDPFNSDSLNDIFVGTSALNQWTGTLSLPVSSAVININAGILPGQYTGAQLATELQTSIQQSTAGVTPNALVITVTYNATQGILNFTSPTYPIIIYDAKLLRNPEWVGREWYSPRNIRSGPPLTSDLRDINTKLSPPQTFANSFSSGQIDLSGVREIYVHSPTLSDGCSVTTDNRRDVIATVVCDVPWGQLVSYRPYSFAERELLQLNNDIPVTLRFYITDGYGKRIPITSQSQYMFLQLSILSYDYIDDS